MKTWTLGLMLDKTMKTNLLLLLTLVIFTACRTVMIDPVTGKPVIDPTTGKKVTQYDEATTEKVKAIVGTTATSLVRRVVEKEPKSTNYLSSLANIFCAMRDSGQFEPTHLTTEIERLTVPADATGLLIDAKNLLVGLYRVLYADRLKVELDREKWPFHVADLMCTSIRTGLADARIQ